MRIAMPRRLLLALLLFAASCGGLPDDEEADNPFFDELLAPDGKEDTGWQSSLKTTEVEVSLEADVAGSTGTRIGAPLDLAQYAMTYLRKRNNVYIEAMEEESPYCDRISWRVGGKWVSPSKMGVITGDKLTHFKVERVNAIIYQPRKTGSSLLGQTFTAVVPLAPSSMYSTSGSKCADSNSHIDLSSTTYWYLWNPDKKECKAQTQKLIVTVTKVMPAGMTTYPEYDRLVSDGKLEAIVFFGQLDDKAKGESDTGFTKARELGRQLTQVGFQQGTSPSGLTRYTRKTAKLTEIVDVSSPKNLKGLDDTAHRAVFENGVREHEIVVYDGHSILGRSDYWAKPSIYSSGYQVFFYNGCLGYQYYVKPILAAKKDWKNADVISNLLETPGSIGSKVIAAFLNGVIQGSEQKGNVSWTTILGNVNDWVQQHQYKSLYGTSGTRTNCFTPSGRKCGS